jgi:uncharacterized heparinase superfamily protein
MPSQWLKNLGHKASSVRMLRPLYDAQLGKLQQSLEFAHFSVEPLVGDAGYGRWIASGQIDLHGHRVPLDMEHWWIGSEYQKTPYFTAIHQFDFLKDLKALGGDTGRRAARVITSQWIDHFERYDTVTWSPSLCAHRLINWLATYSYAYETAEDDFVYKLQSSLFKQYHHLDHCVRHEPQMNSQNRFDSLWALAILSCHIPQLKNDHFDSWLLLLKGAIEDITNTDGGFTNLDLGQWFVIARQLTILKRSFVSARLSVPLWLSKHLETGLRLLSIMVHGDKSLPNFHASFGPNKNDIDRLIRQNHFRFRKTDTHLPKTGYSVLRKGRSILPISHCDDTHTSPNALEFSHGTCPLIVNCGTHLLDDEWRQSLKGINAHSALCINDTEPEKDMIVPMKTNLENLNGSVLWHGTHDGYKRLFQAIHTRRLYLDQSGDDCRGEDLVVRSIATKPLHLTARFHLHPTLKISPVQDGSAMLMQLPSGAGWIFEAAHCSIQIEPSVYTGRHGLSVRKTTQIVLNADMPDLSYTIKWALKRI